MAEKDGVMDTVSRRDKKKRKKLELEVEVLSETGNRMAPIVGYFPSGYDPVSSGADPDVKAFRNKKKPNRVELVVRPDNCNVEFIGKSYAGEAAVPQLSTYALGVFDKETQTLKIVPIAVNKILRMEPRVINDFGEPPEVSEEGIIDEKNEHQMADLANLYGTKKAKNMANKWRSIRQNIDDPSLERTDVRLKDGASEDIEEPRDRNIPPYDASAVTPENAYPLHNIIPKGERGYLLDILETFESDPKVSQNPQFWEKNHYPSFVIHRLQKLEEMQNEGEKKQFACILSYITHLINFRKVATARCGRRNENPNYSEAMSEFKIPPVVYNRFLLVFLDPISNLLSSEKNELLICYILVLTLFADNFRTHPPEIAKDLAMTAASLQPYFLQLGCRPFKEGSFKKSYMILPVPLLFQQLKMKKKRVVR